VIKPVKKLAGLSAGDQKKRRECALDISYCTIKIGGKC